MKTTAFIKTVTDAYRIEEKTVRLYARILKEAGLITSGLRGVNAPHHHPNDLVYLTVALLSTGKAAHAATMYKRFAQMTYQPERSSGPHPANLGIAEGKTLEAVLRHMFTTSMFEDGEEGGPFASCPYLEVQENHRTVTIEHALFVDGEYDYAGPQGRAVFQTVNRSNELTVDDSRALFGIRQARGLASNELVEAVLPFELEFREKVSWETIQKETPDETNQRMLSGPQKAEKGLWFDLQSNGSASDE